MGRRQQRQQQQQQTHIIFSWVPFEPRQENHLCQFQLCVCNQAWASLAQGPAEDASAASGEGHDLVEADATDAALAAWGSTAAADESEHHGD
eukprot:3416772-Pyramimonas_sp.AAC.1